MKYLKFVLIMFLLFSLVLFCSPLTIAAASDSQQTFEEKSVHSCSVGDLVQSKITEDSSLGDKYGGAYIDQEGNLNVLYIGDYAGLEIDDENILFHPADFTKKHLLDVFLKLSDNMEDLGIHSVAIDEINNKVIVCIDDNLDISRIDDIQNLINSQSVEIQEFDHRGETVATTDIKGGQGGKITLGEPPETNKETFTLGLGVKKVFSPYTNYFTIPGHIEGAVGSAVQKPVDNGAQIGNVNAKRNTGSVDASLCTGYGSYVPSGYLIDGSSYVGYATSFYVGQPVKAFEYESEIRSGTILSTSYSEYYSGYTHTDMLKCNYKAVFGDSGAAVISPYVSGTQVVQGVQSGSYLVSGQWVSGISYSITSKFKNIAAYFHINLIIE